MAVGVTGSRGEDLQPNALQGLVVLARLDVAAHLLHRRLEVNLRAYVGRRGATGAGQLAVVVGADELDDSTVEVAEIVRQVGVPGFLEQLPAEFAVAGKRTFAQEVVAESFRTEVANQVHRFDDL